MLFYAIDRLHKTNNTVLGMTGWLRLRCALQSAAQHIPVNI